jgi:hypothetical protein
MDNEKKRKVKILVILFACFILMFSIIIGYFFIVKTGTESHLQRVNSSYSRSVVSGLRGAVEIEMMLKGNCPLSLTTASSVVEHVEKTPFLKIEGGMVWDNSPAKYKISIDRQCNIKAVAQHPERTDRPVIVVNVKTGSISYMQ